VAPATLPVSEYTPNADATQQLGRWLVATLEAKKANFMLSLKCPNFLFNSDVRWKPGWQYHSDSHKASHSNAKANSIHACAHLK
jgi:hypothetical protein